MIYHLTSYIWSCMFDKHHLFLAWDGKYYNKLQDNAFHYCGWGLSCCTKKCDASELESSYEFGFRIKQARIELKLDFWRLKSAWGTSKKFSSLIPSYLFWSLFSGVTCLPNCIWLGTSRTSCRGEVPAWWNSSKTNPALFSAFTPDCIKTSFNLLIQIISNCTGVHKNLVDGRRLKRVSDLHSRPSVDSVVRECVWNSTNEERIKTFPILSFLEFVLSTGNIDILNSRPRRILFI